MYTSVGSVMKKQTVGSIVSSVLTVKAWCKTTERTSVIVLNHFLLCKKTSLLNMWLATYKCAEEVKEVK